jgi:hypothetical protein
MSDQRIVIHKSALDTIGAPLVPEDHFHQIDTPKFSDDLMVGASTVTTWLFGTSDRRKTYHLVESSRLPTFRLGSKIAAQRSVLRAYFWAQQKRGFGNDEIEALVRLHVILSKAREVLGADGKAGPGEVQAGPALFEASQEIERFLGRQ